MEEKQFKITRLESLQLLNDRMTDSEWALIGNVLMDNDKTISRRNSVMELTHAIFEIMHLVRDTDSGLLSLKPYMRVVCKKYMSGASQEPGLDVLCNDMCHTALGKVRIKSEFHPLHDGSRWA